MNYQCPGEVANEVGANAAIVFFNFYFWCQKNRANKKNEKDGLYWTYNSRKALGEIFTFLSDMQIRTCLKKLIEHGYIVSGCYNKAKFDRTLWYAVTEKGYLVMSNSSIGYKQPITLDTDNQPIPDITKDKKPDIINVLCGEIKDAWNKILVDEAPIAKLARVKVMTKARRSSIKARIAECKGEAKDMTDIAHWEELFKVMSKQRFLLGKNDREWQIDLDWLIRPNNFVKVYENKYINL